ncbi:CDP-alcohol phosphatidyltransferase family protein [Rhodosalinus sp. K401]|uniref:CDP-alcohol phosphatidyltransferase family protein n=1 Tax=Rhodosalinus sp. K401 TaxID=3239195 RepID=UPI0035262469
MSDFNLVPAPRRTWPALMRGPRGMLGAAVLGGVPIVLAVAMALVGPDGAAMALALAGYLAGAGFVLHLMRRGYPHGALGLCNVVTLTRLALTSALLAPLAGAAASWAVLAVAGIALSLDGVDGWLARREARVSSFGARFDMEVDAALALILALNAWVAGPAGPAVVLLGLPRYVFAVAAHVLPWLDRPLPERFGRKAVCVLQLGALIALQLDPVALRIAEPLVTGVAAALAWSFARDVLWLWRTRP